MQQVTTESERRTSAARIALTIGLILLVVGPPLLLLSTNDQQPALAPAADGGSLFVLAIPAFLAGVLSFLSPCTLPILPAYFAFTFGANDGAEGAAPSRGRVLLASLAFFAGLATTLVLAGASITAIGQLIGRYRYDLAKIGGIVIIIFGVMSLFGKGFSGMKIGRQRSATLAGAYLYGMTFALGWTACIGPVLGSILTLLLAQGASVLSGAVLSLIYVTGLALPLILVAVFFSHLGQGSRAWRLLRGRGWEVRLAGRPLYLHSTSIISGLLLIIVGVLLVTGQLNYLSRYATTGPAEWALNIEHEVLRFFKIK